MKAHTIAAALLQLCARLVDIGIIPGCAASLGAPEDRAISMTPPAGISRCGPRRISHCATGSVMFEHGKVAAHVHHDGVSSWQRASERRS
jgi:hypothetical protein